MVASALCLAPADTTPRIGDVLLAQHAVVNAETREEARRLVDRAGLQLINR